MKYLDFKTPSLTALTDDLEGETIWHKLGSTPQAIKMDETAGGTMEEKIIVYHIPIIDEEKADEFIEHVNELPYDIEVTKSEV